MDQFSRGGTIHDSSANNFTVKPAGTGPTVTAFYHSIRLISGGRVTTKSADLFRGARERRGICCARCGELFLFTLTS